MSTQDTKTEAQVYKLFGLSEKNIERLSRRFEEAVLDVDTDHGEMLVELSPTDANNMAQDGGYYMSATSATKLKV